MRYLITLIGILLSLQTVAAAPISYEFKDNHQATQYERLIHELRCLVCQNQSLADPQADLAADLRQKVYEAVLKNQSDEQIADYFVARYGDFVRYKPPLDARTALLWFGPVLFLGIGFILFLRKVKFRVKRGQA